MIPLNQAVFTLIYKNGKIRQIENFIGYYNHYDYTPSLFECVYFDIGLYLTYPEYLVTLPKNGELCISLQTPGFPDKKDYLRSAPYLLSIEQLEILESHLLDFQTMQEINIEYCCDLIETCYPFRKQKNDYENFKSYLLFQKGLARKKEI